MSHGVNKPSDLQTEGGGFFTLTRPLQIVVIWDEYEPAGAGVVLALRIADWPEVFVKVEVCAM